MCVFTQITEPCIFSTYGDIEKEPTAGTCKKARWNRGHLHADSPPPRPKPASICLQRLCLQFKHFLFNCICGTFTPLNPSYHCAPVTYLFPKPTSGLKTAVFNISSNASLSYKNASPPSSTASFFHSHSFPVS